ncbi:MAG: DUF4184 family protein [Cyanobacteria bacterium J06634_5]
MPFTLAHPIATLPLWSASKQKLDLPALMVGAAIPDVSYFVALRPVPNIGHSLLGIVTEGIPSALLLLLLGRYLFWTPVLALVPQPISSRIPIFCPYSFLPAKRLLVIIVSIAMGALTHIVWDSFTHHHGWAVERLSFLVADVGIFPIYKWLQYSGGLIGFPWLLWLAAQFVRKRSPRYRPERLLQRWQGLSWGFIAIALMLTVYYAVAVTPESSLSTLIVNAIVGSVSGLFLGLFLYSALYWLNEIFRSQTRYH